MVMLFNLYLCLPSISVARIPQPTVLVPASISMQSGRNFNLLFLRAAAHGPAVHALVASAAPNHDGTAVRARRRILLIETRHAADAGHGRSTPECLCRNRNNFFAGVILFVV